MATDDILLNRLVVNTASPSLSDLMAVYPVAGQSPDPATSDADAARRADRNPPQMTTLQALANAVRPPDATTETAGLVELATLEQARQGLDNVRAVTSLSLRTIVDETLIRGIVSFTRLIDTPSTLGTAGQQLRVNTAASSLEFFDAPYPDAASIVSALSALQDTARLPATAVRDLPTGGDTTVVQGGIGNNLLSSPSAAIPISNLTSAFSQAIADLGIRLENDTFYTVVLENARGDAAGSYLSPIVSTFRMQGGRGEFHFNADRGGQSFSFSGEFRTGTTGNSSLWTVGNSNLNNALRISGIYAYAESSGGGSNVGGGVGDNLLSSSIEFRDYTTANQWTAYATLPFRLTSGGFYFITVDFPPNVGSDLTHVIRMSEVGHGNIETADASSSGRGFQLDFDNNASTGNTRYRVRLPSSRSGLYMRIVGIYEVGGGSGSSSGGGSSTFAGLTDTPASLGTAGQIPAVNAGGTALEFVDAPSGGGQAETGASIVSKLTGLSGNARLPYSALRDAPAAGITTVTRNSSLTGAGTPSSPLGVANPFTTTDELKLDGIEQNATADQTAAEIRNRLETLTGSARLSYNVLRDTPTNNITIGAELLSRGISVNTRDGLTATGLLLVGGLYLAVVGTSSQTTLVTTPLQGMSSVLFRFGGGTMYSYIRFPDGEARIRNRVSTFEFSSQTDGVRVSLHSLRRIS